MSAQAEASAEAALNDEAATVADDDADHDSDSSDSVLTTAEREEREAAATRRRDEWLAQPKLMVGRKDPALFPAPAPAPDDDADSGGTYDYAASGALRCGALAGHWAAVCTGGLYEGMPKANTHRVAVRPRFLGAAQAVFLVADGGRSAGGDARAAKAAAELGHQLERACCGDPVVTKAVLETALKRGALGLNLVRPTVVVLRDDVALVANCGRTRVAAAFDGFTFRTAPREEHELSSKGDRALVVDEIALPAASVTRAAFAVASYAVATRGDADALAAAAAAAASGDALEDAARAAAEAAERAAWEDKGDNSFIDDMSVVLISVARADVAATRAEAPNAT